ncbi:MAG: hypothetical protein KAR19_08810 [Bacteroidales bacterium]|nr:hypothetical protein [Bacteroidales bacterium]
MDYNEVIKQIIFIAINQFPNEGHEIGAGTNASDLAAWNSLNHVLFIASIERSFEIKFELLQMIEMTSIEEIAKATHKMLK